MHLTFVISSVIGLTTCVLWWYLIRQSEKLAAEFVKKGIFKEEETLFYTYNLSIISDVQVDPEKVAELKRRLDRISKVTAPYYGLVALCGICSRICMVCGLFSFILFLVEKGILR